MNQFPPYKKKEEYDWNEPRPPVPGKESRPSKMTDSRDSCSEVFAHETPSCFKWANSLSALLQDPEGVKLFKEYAERERQADWLNFYFAVEGLKQQVDQDKIKQIINAIYKFLKRSPNINVPIEIHNKVKQGQKDVTVLKSDIFDQLQSEVEHSITNITYRNFLQSDDYVQHIQISQNPPILSSASSSSNSEDVSKLISRSSTLPTLHEDSELVNYDSDIGRQCSIPLALTRDALLATEQRRLEMRPAGIHNASVYTAYSSYNPVSRRDSELQSFSSGQTDSDTMSLSNFPNDGHPHGNRKHHQQSSMERRMLRENIIENPGKSLLTVIPRTQRVDPKKQQISNNPVEFFNQLRSKLEKVQKEREKDEMLARKLQQDDLTSQSLAEALRERLQLEELSDQDILDQHVSRVWSDLTPIRSPGSNTPGQNTGKRRQTGETNLFGPSTSAQSSMRHSKSMPDGTRKLSNKWPSVNTDSGISLLSTDTLGKYKEPRPSTSTSVLENPKKKLDEEIRKIKRQLPSSQIAMPPPAIPAKPQQFQLPDYCSFTIVVYSFCDEEVPYRIKIPGANPPTLKQFKDNLPKKGNYRFFFKTRCDDLDNPIIQEEISNDSEVLPLFEGKVMGTVKSAD